MKNLIIALLLFFSFTLSAGCGDEGNPAGNDNGNENKNSTVVSKHGQLKVSGTSIVDKNGDEIVLRGMSLFWSQWMPDYYNKETIEWLVDDWKCTVIRAAIAAERGGYRDNPDVELAKVRTVIDACIEKGIYVIVDWHTHSAETNTDNAVEFFGIISSEYGDKPNIIYEIYNEPLDVSWNDVIKPYSETVISAIRNNDPDNIIVAGTRNWSQDVQDVIGNRIDDDNVVYSLHFYSSTHQQDLRDKAITARNAGVPVFVTEWGMSEASGTGDINYTTLNEWTSFLETYNLSWCNWSIANKDETSAALLPSTTGLSGWSTNELSESGNNIRDYLLRMNGSMFD